MSTQRTNPHPINDTDAREQALQVIDRWKSQGFDTLVCHPSGYCSPANSRILRPMLPDDYAAYPIDSDEAIDRVLASISAGVAYRV